ncbi:MAG TPA: GNAT family N-acetyltransferase [Vicinamibacterales bacterium]|jgi:GNAT superfamily N-acetyltransferase
MAGTVSARPARLSDAGEIARLVGQLGYEVDGPTTASRLLRILPQPRHRFLIAELEGRLVGWVHACVWEFVETGAFATIGGLVVDQSFRRRGVGRFLMGQAEAWAVEQGCSVVRLWSSVGRTEAHGFYEQLGYSNIKTQYSFAKSVDPTMQQNFGGFVPRLDP